MSTQNFKNHIRFYTPHHFVFYPVILVLIIISIRNLLVNPANTWEWAVLAGLSVLLAWFSFMTRQHYGLTLQNRIIRSEMRFRYYVLTQQRFEPIEKQISFGQLAALRFASDAELPGLIKRTLEEQLPPREIKMAIKNWVADDMRI